MAIDIASSLFIFWSIALAPPLLTRFLLLKKPMQKASASVFVVVFFFINFSAQYYAGMMRQELEGGSPPNPGMIGLFLMGWATYAILTHGDKQQEVSSEQHFEVPVSENQKNSDKNEDQSIAGQSNKHLINTIKVMIAGVALLVFSYLTHDFIMNYSSHESAKSESNLDIDEYKFDRSGKSETDQVTVLVSSQSSQGVRESDLDQNFLNNLESWLVDITRKKAKQIYIESGNDPDNFTDNYESSSVYNTVSEKKLAIIKMSMNNTFKSVSIFGIKDGQLHRIVCMKEGSKDILVYRGKCGAKIKEVFGVSPLK